MKFSCGVNLMRLPLTVHTAYQDLLEAHRARTMARIQGSPFTKEIAGKTYWYTRQRIGKEKVERYVGPDNDEIRRRIDGMRSELEDERSFERRCARLVAQLRAAGLATLDRQTGSILNAMARVGVFRLGGTLVGTHAFRLYGAELGASLSGIFAVTEDVDIAAFENLKLAIHEQADPSLAETFKALQLEPAPNLDEKGRPTRWRLKGGGVVVDFLAPRMQSRRQIVKLEPLNVYAQTLPFLNYLIADPIPAVVLYRSGVLVQIPRPERYAIHKLIVAQRRTGPGLGKAPKDLTQAEALISILVEDRPGEIAEAYETAMESGKKWREAIAASLKQRPAIKTLLDRIG